MTPGWGNSALFSVHFQGHQGEVFVLESHPNDPRVLLSASHDGLVKVWDMLMGVCLHTVTMDGEDEPSSIFDCKFSPDGLMCAAVDMSGNLTLMGFGSSVEYDKVRGRGGGVGPRVWSMTWCWGVRKWVWPHVWSMTR